MAGQRKYENKDICYIELDKTNIFDQRIVLKDKNQNILDSRHVPQSQAQKKFEELTILFLKQEGE